MNKKIASIATTTALVLTAAAAWAASGWTAAGTVSTVYSGYPDGSVYLQGLENKAGCPQQMIHFAPDTSDPALVQKLALSAMLSGKKLACAVNGCSPTNPDYQSGRQCKITD